MITTRRDNNVASRMCFLLTLNANTPPVSAIVYYIIVTKILDCKNSCEHAVAASSKQRRTSKALRRNALLVLLCLTYSHSSLEL